MGGVLELWCSDPSARLKRRLFCLEANIISNGIFVRAGLSVLNNVPYFSLNSLSTSSTVRSACPDIFIHELTTKNRTHNTPRWFLSTDSRWSVDQQFLSNKIWLLFMFPSSPLHLVSVLSSSWLLPVADPAVRQAATTHRAAARRRCRPTADQLNMIKLDTPPF